MIFLTKLKIIRLNQYSEDRHFTIDEESFVLPFLDKIVVNFQQFSF